MSELRQLIERLKHGKHDQSTHGRRGRRGGGGGGGMSSSESRQANRDDRALIAQSKSEITRLQGMKKTAQDAIARGGETQPDGTFRKYSQGEMDYYKREVATNDRFIESNQRTIQIANDRIRGRKNGEVSASSSRASKPVRTNSEPVQTNNDIDPFVTQQLGRINRRIAKIEAERINGVLTPIQQRALDRALSDKRDYEDELRRSQYQ